jgi:multiple sugar transport system substrate-binding protein
MSVGSISRRKALRALALAGGSGAAVAVLAGCGETQIVEVVKEVPVEKVVTQVVEKAVVQEKIVTVPVAMREETPKRDNVTIVMQSWWSPSIGLPFQAWDEHIRTFTKTSPWVKIEVQYVPWSDMIKKYLAGVAAGDVPDVFHSSIAFARDLWDQGTLEELSEYIKTTPDMAESTFMSATTPYRNAQGKWFALPWEGFDGRALYYNVEHFEEAGLDPDFESTKLWDWDGLLEASQKLTQRDGDKVTRSGFLIIRPHMEYFCSWLYCQDANFYGPGETKVAFNQNDAAKNMVDWHLAALNDHNISIPIVAERPDVNLFQQGQASIAQNGHWAISKMRTDVPNLKFDLMAIPKGPSGSKMRTVAFTNLHALPTKAKYKDDAWDFMAWQAGLEQQIKKLQLMDFPSPRLDFYQTNEWKIQTTKVPQLKNLPTMLEDGGAWPFVRFSEVNNTYTPIMEGMMIGQREVDVGLAEMETSINEILGKAAEMVG